MDHSKFGVLLSLYTGIRVGELCALQWEDFDLAHSKLKIRKTMQRIQDLGNGSVSKTKIVITEPKSQCSIREIPLPLFIVDVAKKFASNPKAYILTGTDRYIEPRTMQNRFKSYVKECNVEPANFHVLRHTFATRCVEVGFEVKDSCSDGVKTLISFSFFFMESLLRLQITGSSLYLAYSIVLFIMVRISVTVFGDSPPELSKRPSVSCCSIKISIASVVSCES